MYHFLLLFFSHTQFASRDELFIPAGADNAFLIDDLLVGTVRPVLRFHVETRDCYRLRRGFRASAGLCEGRFGSAE